MAIQQHAADPAVTVVAVADLEAARVGELAQLALRVPAVADVALAGVAADPANGGEADGFAAQAALRVVTVAGGAGRVADAGQPAFAVGSGVPGEGVGLVAEGQAGDAAQRVVAAGFGLAAGVGLGLELAGSVVGVEGGAGIRAELLQQFAQAIVVVAGGVAEWVFDGDQVVQCVVAEFSDQHPTGLGRIRGFQLHQAIKAVVAVLGGAVQRIGDAGAVADGVVGVAGDNFSLGVLDLGQAAQGIVFVGFIQHHGGGGQCAGDHQQQRPLTEARQG